jgi:hypothetical protein
MSKAKTSKAKGRTGQQEIRDKILENFQGLQDGDVLSTTMGESGADIKLSPAARRLLPISVEVKRRKNGMKTQYQWIEQARNHTLDPPVVFFRADRKPWLVIVELDHYMELLKAWKKKSKP